MNFGRGAEKEENFKTFGYEIILEPPQGHWEHLVQANFPHVRNGRVGARGEVKILDFHGDGVEGFT
jgi:hypothetical protein